jgi:hypothetical protein
MRGSHAGLGLFALGCSSATIVQNGFSTEQKVRTYVVGFNLGPGGSNLDALAEAGGSGKAFLIDRGDIGAQFVDAMASISNTPLPCKFDIPIPAMGTTLDIDQVALGYTPSATGVKAQVPKLRGLSDCDLNMGNGWFFDSPSNPTQIITCPGTCTKFASGSVTILTGCTPLTGLTK